MYTPNYYGGNGQVLPNMQHDAIVIGPNGEQVTGFGRDFSGMLQADAYAAQQAYAKTAGKIGPDGQLVPGYYPQTKAEWQALGRHAAEMGAQNQASLFNQQAQLFGYGGGGQSAGGGGKPFQQNAPTGQFVPNGQGGMVWKAGAPAGSNFVPNANQPGQIQSSGQSSNTGGGQGVDSSLYDPWKAALLQTIKSPGIDARTEQDMVNRTNEGLSIAQADALRGQQQQAAAAGFANSGDQLRGQTAIDSQFAGLKAANARDTHIGVAGQNQQTQLQAMGQAGSFLSQQQANQHSDKLAYANLLNQQANQQNVPDTSNKGFGPPMNTWAPPGQKSPDAGNSGNIFGDFLASLQGKNKGKTQSNVQGNGFASYDPFASNTARGMA